MNPRPLIGIAGSYDREKKTVLLGETYANAVLHAGGLPMILPVVTDEAVMESLLDEIDGLLLSGGGDVNPECYGEEREPECGEPNPPRDAFELKIIALARKRNMPILGICRGAQVLNVAYGGTLIQDIPKAFSIPLEHHRQPEPYDVLWHDVQLKPDGLFARIIGKDRIKTNSMHHQAIKKLGKSLVVEATAEPGIIEAVSEEGNDAVLAVQFHPERYEEKQDYARRIFAHFVGKAASYREMKRE